MDQRTDRFGLTSSAASSGTIRIVSRQELSGSPRWQVAFARQRKDHRYYELV
jgi:hypothetical protein